MSLYIKNINEFQITGQNKTSLYSILHVLVFASCFANIRHFLIVYVPGLNTESLNRICNHYN